MKKLLAIFLILIITMMVIGCDSAETKKNNLSEKPEYTIAINAGDSIVYLDEALYYAYTAQATYETVFISEGKEINWESKMKEDVSWQQGVKSTVLDDICRRECMYALAEKYNVKLNKEEKKQIENEVVNFYNKTNKKLLDKINITKERLIFVFEKAKIASRIEEIMIASDKSKADATYENWKKGNTVTAGEQWKNITFDKHIFGLEDLEN